MRCLFCEQPATVHVTEHVDNVKRELHLCERCARERQLLPAPPGPPINLKVLLTLLAVPAEGAAGGPTPAEPRCPVCGLTTAAFKAVGRLGCEHDYNHFQETLVPLLEQVHRANLHLGKTPRHIRPEVRSVRLGALNERLRSAVAAEDYEVAAAARDALRLLQQGTTA